MGNAAQFLEDRAETLLLLEFVGRVNDPPVGQQEVDVALLVHRVELDVVDVGVDLRYGTGVGSIGVQLHLGPDDVLALDVLRSLDDRFRERRLDSQRVLANRPTKLGSFPSNGNYCVPGLPPFVDGRCGGKKLGGSIPRFESQLVVVIRIRLGPGIFARALPNTMEKN